MFYRTIFIILSLIFFSQIIHAKTPTTLHFKNSKIDSEEIAKLVEEWAVPVAAFPREAHYYIVQYSSGSSAEIREKLERVSDVVRYIPDRAYIVRLKGTEDDLNQIADIEWVGEYHPYLRVERDLLKGLTTEEVEVEITLFPGSSVESVAKKIDQLSLIAQASVIEIGTEILKVRVKKSEIPKIALIEGIEWIQKATEATLVDGIGLSEGKSWFHASEASPDNFESLNGFGSGAKALNPDRFYEKGIRGEGELIAIADSGLDRGEMDHLPKDLAGRVRKE